MLKVMSKMGISTYQSYCGAQIFDAVGLSSRPSSTSISPAPPRMVEGIGLPKSPRRPSSVTRAFSDDPVLATHLDVGGEYAFRTAAKSHVWTPDTSPPAACGARQRARKVPRIRPQVNDQNER
jgi:glutamate synthase (NADPH/NADH) large chain